MLLFYSFVISSTKEFLGLEMPSISSQVSICAHVHVSAFYSGLQIQTTQKYMEELCCSQEAT